MTKNPVQMPLMPSGQETTLQLPRRRHSTNSYTGCAKKRPNLFLSELREILIKFDNFWQTGSQYDRNM